MMCKRFFFLTCFFLMLLLKINVSIGAPATIWWVGGANASGSWADVNNWWDGSTNRLPLATEKAKFDVSGATLIVDANAVGASRAWTNELQGPGLLQNNTIKITGGDFNTNLLMTFGFNKTGTFIVTGGTPVVTGGFRLCSNNNGILNVSGGTLTLGALVAPFHSSATYSATVNLFGNGHLHLTTNAPISIGLNGNNVSFDIRDNGMLTAVGDRTAGLQSAINNGYITAYGGNAQASLNLDYNQTTPGMTTLTASLFIQLIAFNPCPDNQGASLMAPTLTWTPGDLATKHDVYFGSDPNAVNGASKLITDIDGNGQVGLGDVLAITQQWLTNPSVSFPSADIDGSANVDFEDFALISSEWQKNSSIFKGRIDTSSFNPGILQKNKTYYWRIDEVNSQNVWRGDLWSFEVEPNNGAYPIEIASWCSATKQAQRQAARDMIAQLNIARNNGDPNFTITPGNYRFEADDYQLLIFNNFSNIVIDANNVTFWIGERNTSATQTEFIAFRDCSNVTLRGLTVDFDPLPMTQGIITSLDSVNNWIEMDIDPGFMLPNDSALDFFRTSNTNSVLFDSNGIGLGIKRDHVDNIVALGGRRYKFHMVVGRFSQEPYATYRPVSVGDRLAVMGRDARTFGNQRCANMVFEDITIYSAPGTAIGELNGAGGNTYRRCNIIRRPGTQRLIASNNDTFHSTRMIAGPNVVNCEFSFCGDDLINIQSFPALVYQRTTPTSLIINDFSFNESQVLSVGEMIYFYNYTDLQPFGSATILSLTPVTDPVIIADAVSMSSQVSLATFPSMPFIVTVDTAVSINVGRTTLVGSYYKSGRGFVIQGCNLHDGWARGIVIRGSNGTIENNILNSTGGSGIVLGADQKEMPMPLNITIRGNTCSDCAFAMLAPTTSQLGSIATTAWGVGSPIKPYFLDKNIVIENNTIIRSPSGGIYIGNAENVLVQNNTIMDPGYFDPLGTGTAHVGERADYGIFVAGSIGVTILNNNITAPNAPYYLGPIRILP